MSVKLRRILGITAIVLIVILGLAAIIAPPVVRNMAKQSFPDTDGSIQLAGLDSAVDIYRDSAGIPHIYAETQHDLFFAQGYVHAQDRFWQMDFWRHQGAGRLSELLGSATLDIDKFIRTLGWERTARMELTQLDPESLAILEYYAEGVNAYLLDHSGTALSLEYAFLPILNRGYQPEPWTPLNSLTWAKAMAWDLKGNIDTEINRAMLLKVLGDQKVEQLYPAYPLDRPVIVPNPHITTDNTQSLPDQFVQSNELVSALTEIKTDFSALDAFRGVGSDGIGSNSWVISAELSSTGFPILANDPHLGVQLPSIWYENALHCKDGFPDCRYNVSGFSFAGTPGIIIGHNDRIAWGFTNTGPDVMDLYIEKINPENPNQYEYENDWVDMEIVEEKIIIAGGETEILAVQLTRHGPIITSVYDLEEFKEETSMDIPQNYAISLRWTALEPSCVFCAIWEFNQAEDWEDFRDAASRFAVPAQNLIYADIEGNIGYQMPGNIPIRQSNHSGMQPVPGWTGDYEWQGYIPFEKLPYAYNPEEGYIVTANNAVVGNNYPYTISRQWAYGFRAQRIVDMIEEAPGLITIDYVKSMQGDNKDLFAELLLPTLLGMKAHTEDVQIALDILSSWDYQNNLDAAPAALFSSFWKHLLINTYADELPEFFQPEGGSGWMQVTLNLLEQPQDDWWDDKNSDQIETRDDILNRALQSAMEEMTKEFGKDSADWSWGELHTITFRHGVMNDFPIINLAFNRGPFTTAGGQSIVNATSWNALESYEVDWLPSMRMIVDFSDLQNSQTMHTTGQSGHAYNPHYIDLAEPLATDRVSHNVLGCCCSQGRCREFIDFGAVIVELICYA